MISKEEREKDKAILAAATDPHRDWKLGRGVPPFGTPDEVFVTACGACLWNERGALDREEDGLAIVTAHNRLPLYIADAEEMDRRIEMMAERARMLAAAQPDDVALSIHTAGMREVIEFLRGGQ